MSTVESSSLTYAGAVNAALRRALTTFPEALLFGEDVALPGGVFGCTKGLREAFGDRVFDTPISESAILGAAVGASIAGRRPIVEIMWADFSLVALDQLINQAANVRYVSCGRLTAPLTVRMQQGATPGSCAQHSQNLEAVFAHIPGLLVAMPATVQDAHDLLLSAIAADDPAIVLENRRLYFGERTQVDLTRPIEAPGQAIIRRSGSQLTMVALGGMLGSALEAADRLAVDSVSIEVIDPRWLVPFDEQTVLTSLAKTGRLMVVHEANRSGGFGAEIAARCVDAGFDLLDAPVKRVACPDSRIPAAPHLQAALLPNVDDIVATARQVLAH